MAVDMLVAILLIVLYLFLGHWYRNQNSGVKVWPIVGLLPLLVSNAEGILYFFTDMQTMKTFEKGAEYREIFEPFGQGILTLDSHVWKRQRKVLQSLTKNNKKYAAYLQMLKGSLIPVLERFLRLGTELDLKDVLHLRLHRGGFAL
ncbi:hypothetical protein Gotri_002378 [Gossypium trilobum]|uniref:Cytochrome P450 n=1 Tax=Gossypium trilobum TaxID=34281 RepID=A0A7J9F922_9ROSI|nr:hypothetical protein [Gossypium trilobum]